MPRLFKKWFPTSPLSAISDEVLRSIEVGLVEYFGSMMPIANQIGRAAAWSVSWYAYEVLVLQTAP